MDTTLILAFFGVLILAAFSFQLYRNREVLVTVLQMSAHRYILFDVLAFGLTDIFGSLSLLANSNWLYLLCSIAHKATTYYLFCWILVSFTPKTQLKPFWKISPKALILLCATFAFEVFTLLCAGETIFTRTSILEYVVVVTPSRLNTWVWLCLVVNFAVAGVGGVIALMLIYNGRYKTKLRGLFLSKRWYLYSIVIAFGIAFELLTVLGLIVQEVFNIPSLSRDFYITRDDIIKPLVTITFLLTFTTLSYKFPQFFKHLLSGRLKQLLNQPDLDVSFSLFKSLEWFYKYLAQSFPMIYPDDPFIKVSNGSLPSKVGLSIAVNGIDSVRLRVLRAAEYQQSSHMPSTIECNTTQQDLFMFERELDIWMNLLSSTSRRNVVILVAHDFVSLSEPPSDLGNLEGKAHYYIKLGSAIRQRLEK